MFFMTDEEIIHNFNHAANKTLQVGILSELNVVSKSEMEKKLISLGLDVPEKKNGGKNMPRVTNKSADMIPLEFEFSSDSAHKPMTIGDLISALSELSKVNPDAIVSFGRKGDRISSIATLTTVTTDGKKCIDVRLV